MYCKYCGAEIADDSAFCSKCGSAFDLQVQPTSGMVCPECGGGNVDIQVMQVNRGGATVTKTKGKIIQRKGHSLLSWLLFWWLWLIVALFDILLWIFAFPFRLAYGLLKKKKYDINTTTVSSTKNSISYKKIYICKSCGHIWDVDMSQISKRGIVSLLS